MIFSYPDEQNDYLSDHVYLLLESYRLLTGRHLIEADTPASEAASRIFNAEFVVLSHNTEPDPILTYINLAGLQLFEMPWEKMQVTPSRFTAEAPVREERERLLNKVAADGYIDDYTGVRVSASGRRFRIEKATVWNLINNAGVVVGQAATFNNWIFLE